MISLKKIYSLSAATVSTYTPVFYMYQDVVGKLVHINIHNIGKADICGGGKYITFRLCGCGLCMYRRIQTTEGGQQ